MLHPFLAVDHEGERPGEVTLSLVTVASGRPAATAALGKRTRQPLAGKSELGEEVFPPGFELGDEREQIRY
jgi:hypothetical protein